MDLHLALKNIIQTEGKDIIKDTKIIHILNDFNAFQNIPASKYILRAIIADGYAEMILGLSKWDGKADAMVQKFANSTGFVITSVEHIFRSLAFGLGFINDINGNNNTKTNNSSKSNNVQTQQNVMGWRHNMTKDEKENYLLSLVEFNREMENKIGVCTKNLSCNIISSKEFTFFVEIKKNNYKQNTYASLRIVIYDVNGKIKINDFLGFLNDNNPSLCISDCYIEFPIKQIGKIYIYWE